MEIKQPKWELIANLGDVNPIDYGGYFIYRDTTGVYPEEGEKLISPDTDEGTWYVYRIILERKEQLSDGKIIPYRFSKRTDLPYPKTRVQFEICTDCVYYLNYGRLDDLTMA